MRNRCHYDKGQVLIPVIVFGLIAVYSVGAFANWAALNIKVSRHAFNREQAMQIAEAGIDYYRWHLAHAPTDFQDGGAGPGPYVHDFYDKDGNVVGQFSLSITAPYLGSTLVTIRSTGTVNADQNISRTLEVKMGKPSFAKYAWVINGFVNYTTTAEVFGPIHANGGIRFDGLAHNIVASAASTSDDLTHTGANEFGVHTHEPPLDPLPPNPVPNRPDVFEADRQFPVPAVDFAGITADLAQMKADAQTDGFYRAASGALGYHVVLKTNDKFALYRVTSLVNLGGCTNSASQSGWGMWSIQNEFLLGTYDMPGNGLIFLEDHTFVNGQINGARVSIVAATLPDNPATRKNIIVNNDLLYTAYDGSDVIGLIAQGYVNVGLISEDDLRIDAAIMAQNGWVGRYSYASSNCGATRSRALLTTYGMLGSNARPFFVYGASNGYQARTYMYDANLLYGPPPSFPLTSDQYVPLSWEEI